MQKSGVAICTLLLVKRNLARAECRLLGYGKTDVVLLSISAERHLALGRPGKHAPLRLECIGSRDSIPRFPPSKKAGDRLEHTTSDNKSAKGIKTIECCRDVLICQQKEE